MSKKSIDVLPKTILSNKITNEIINFDDIPKSGEFTITVKMVKGEARYIAITVKE